MVYAAPVALSLIAAALVAWRVKSRPRGPELADSLRRTGAMFIALHCTAMLAAQGAYREAALLGAVSVAGLVGMTIVREAILLLEQPLEYMR